MRLPQQCSSLLLLIALFAVQLTGCLDSELRDYGFPDSGTPNASLPNAGVPKGQFRSNGGTFGLPLRETNPESHTGFFFDSEAQAIESRLGYGRDR
jgi:hypothetical protein